MQKLRNTGASFLQKFLYISGGKPNSKKYAKYTSPCPLFLGWINFLALVLYLCPWQGKCLTCSHVSSDKNKKYDNANKLLAFLLLFSVELEECQWGVHGLGICVTLCIAQKLWLFIVLSPQRNSICFFVIPFQNFNTDDKCPNQTQILPNNRAHCEVRWKRDGLLSERRTGT